MAIVEPYDGDAVAARLRRRRLERVLRDHWRPGLARRLTLTRDVHDAAFTRLLADQRVDLMVVSRWGIIRPEVFNIPPLGTLNTHVSLLPELRGPTPIEGAILAGLDRTGVTIHLMSEGIDTGDIVLQRRFSIGTSDAECAVQLRAAKLMREMYADVIQHVRSGSMETQPQAESGRFYFSWRKCFGSNPWEELVIDWSAPAWLIQRASRIQRCLTKWQNRDLHLLEIRLGRDDAKGEPGVIVTAGRHSIVVATGEGNIEARITGEHGTPRWRKSRTPIIPSVGERLDSATWPGWKQFASWATASAGVR